ncbi:hypothetical protein TNCV_3878041 [Trichonephila clavipes]|nr:hypothetical protein TNCV_3878041 [Trichonephila clavipes]
MQVRTSAYANSTPIPSNQLFCIVTFHERMRGLFRVPLSLHTRTRRVSHSRLNRDSSVNSTWLQSCCSQSRCSAAHLLRAHTVAWGQRNADYLPTCIEPSLMKPIRTVWLNTLRPVAESNCLCSCVAFSVLFRRVLSCVYRSSVDVVARGRPAPWSTSNISCFLESIPQLCNNTSGDSNSVRELRCVCPDSSLPITRHAMDSGKSRC